MTSLRLGWVWSLFIISRSSFRQNSSQSMRSVQLPRDFTRSKRSSLGASMATSKPPAPWIHLASAVVRTLSIMVFLPHFVACSQIRCAKTAGPCCARSWLATRSMLSRFTGSPLCSTACASTSLILTCWKPCATRNSAAVPFPLPIVPPTRNMQKWWSFQVAMLFALFLFKEPSLNLKYLYNGEKRAVALASPVNPTIWRLWVWILRRFQGGSSCRQMKKLLVDLLPALHPIYLV